MYSRIIFYGLAGLWWGSIFGVIHLISITSDVTGTWLALADVGLSTSVGGIVGLLIGSILSFIPDQLRALNIIRAVRAHLMPDQSKALHFRSRASATCWTILLFIGVTLKLTFELFTLLLTRVQQPIFGALSLTLIGLLMLSLSLALAGVFRAVLSRLIETTVRRLPSLSPISHPMGNLIAGLILVGLDLGLWLQAREPLERAAISPFIAPLLLTGFIVFGGELLCIFMARASAKRARIVFLGSLFFFATAGIVGIRSSEVQTALSRGHSIPGTILHLIQIPFDQDKDGFAPVLGGGDCDDLNPLINPKATEVFGNLVDENCDGIVGTEVKDAADEAESKQKVELPKGPLNIVLITISNLRPDHLSFFGYGRETTPNLDAFAASSVYFTNAYSASPSLSHGLASLLSGRYASELERTQEKWPRFSPSNDWIALRLKAKEYTTAAFLSHWYFDEGSGLESGFDTWQPKVAEKGRTEAVASSQVVYERAAMFLQSVPVDQPYFLWTHVIDPKPSYLEHMGIARFGRDLVAQYDHEIRYVDEMLGLLLKALRQRTDWDRTAVILTAESGNDFGENFSRDGILPLSERRQRVPLFLRIPGVRARPVKAPVSLVNIASTIEELAAGSVQDEETVKPDRSVIRQIEGTKSEPTPILTEMLTERGDQFSLSFIVDKLKLNYDGPNRRWRLYDLENDPSELDDQYALKPAIAQQLRRSLARYRSNMALVAPTLK